MSASDLGGIRVMAGAALVAEPWRNGAGTTRQIAAAPAPDGGFLWRLSLASIDAAAPFSGLAGVDRLIAVAAGRVALTGPQAPFPQELGEGDAPLAFAGEAAVAGAPLGGAALALNLMVRRGQACGQMARQGAGAIAPGVGGLLVFAPAPVALSVAGQALALARHDTLIAPAGVAVAAAGPCLWARVALTPG